MHLDFLSHGLKNREMPQQDNDPLNTKITKLTKITPIRVVYSGLYQYISILVVAENKHIYRR